MTTAKQATTAKPTTLREPAAPREWNLKRAIGYITLGLWVLGGLTVIAYGFWGYRSYQRSHEKADLQAQLATVQRELRLVDNAAKPEAVDAQTQAAITKAAALSTTFMAPVDGIRVTDQISQLGRRTGVQLTSVRVSVGVKQKINNMDFIALPVSVIAKGDQGQLDDFFNAVQAGVIPWLVVTNSSSSRSGEPGLIVQAMVYTLPDGQPRAAAPRLTGTVDTSSQTTAVHPGETDRVLFAITVHSNLSSDDALRELHVRLSAPAAVSQVRLYAETSGDTQLEPKTDSLIAGAASAQEVVFTPATPYRFASGKDQRFYVAADVQKDLSASVLLDASMPAQAISFTSRFWPDQPVGGSLVARQPLTAVPLSLKAVTSAPVAINLASTFNGAQGLAFRIVQQPTHGILTGTAPNMTYISLSGYSGSDTFTYTVIDGQQESQPAAVTVTVSTQAGG